MGIWLSAWIENIVGKGEIARYEQFLLFPQCFQKQSVVDVLKRVSSTYLTLTTQSIFRHDQQTFENIRYKQKNACKQ